MVDNDCVVPNNSLVRLHKPKFGSPQFLAKAKEQGYFFGILRALFAF